MTTLLTLKFSFSRFPFRLYVALIFKQLFPTAYLTFRTSVLGSVADASVLRYTTHFELSRQMRPQCSLYKSLPLLSPDVT